MLGDALEPLLTRYEDWMTLDDDAVVEDREEDPTQIRALQLVLRLERTPAPSWHSALALAASACALVCLDPAWAPEVEAYCRGHIRKVTRRARGAQWEATADLPSVLVIDGPTEVRAVVPGLVTDLDKRIAKLQVGGTDVPLDAPTPPPPGALRVYVNDEPPLTVGKLMAQTGHAGMLAAALLAHDDQGRLQQWYDAGCPAHASRVPAADFSARCHALSDPQAAWENHGLVAVRDAGFTEVAPGTITVLGEFPTGPRS